ncbi:MAG: C-terminal binding protein [Dehalococcoidia bacterium]
MAEKRLRVLHTDPDNLGAPLNVEEAELAKIGAEIIPVHCTTEEEVIEAGRDVEGILNIKAPIRRKAVQGLERCRVIVRYGVGLDTLEPEAATERGIVIANVPDFCMEEVSNHAMMMLLACAKKLGRLNAWVKEGHWGRELLKPMGAIHGQTLGLVGCGNIARATAVKARAFNMEVLGYDPFIDPSVPRASGIEVVGLQELLERSDYVSLHTPLTPETRHLMGEKELQLMKPSAFLINTSRGPVVNEGALIKALQEGWIAGAGLDVFEREPIDPDSPLLKMDNVVVTPHTASYSDAAFDELHHRVAEEMVRVLTGHWPLHLVNPAVRKKIRLLEPE